MSFYGLADSSYGSNYGNNNNYYNSNSFLLMDYASIKNGSYSKLMKSYYGPAPGVSNTGNGSTATSKDDVKNLTSVKDAAGDLKKAAEDLLKTGKDSVFNLVTKENEDGTTTTDFDKDAIYKSVSKFVEEYNKLIESGSDLETKSISRNLQYMLGTTKAQTNMLSKVGITASSDGKLTVDKDKFLKSDMNTVKDIFQRQNSFGQNISNRASKISQTASSEAAKANTYSKYGNYNYNYSAGSSFASYI